MFECLPSSIGMFLELGDDQTDQTTILLRQDWESTEILVYITVPFHVYYTMQD